MSEPDLIMPIACLQCDTDMVVPVAAVLAAATGRRPLICPSCGHTYGIADIGAVSFFDRAEWDAWDDTDPSQAPPDHYHAMGAVAVPMPRTNGNGRLPS
jgi:hypothetical protein